MEKSGLIEWNCMSFVSYISVDCSAQTIIVDKNKGVVRLEDGVLAVQKVEIPLTKELLAGVESVLEEMHIFDWPERSLNLGADGEQWTFEFYRGDERILLRSGSRAYPNGYGKWMDFYAGLLKDNGIAEVHTCYRKEQGGCEYGTV